MKKTKVSIVINLLIIISTIIGLYLNFAAGHFMSSNSILYYTVQSNILVLISSIIMIIFDIKTLKDKTYKIPNFIFLLKYITTIAITLTFIVFTVLLIPQMVILGSANYLKSLTNITLHFATPIFAVVSLFVCDNDLIITKKTFLFGLIIPFYYLIFSLILSILPNEGLFVGFNGTISKFPYFFLDYISNGWFRLGNNMFEMGTFYYIIIILVFIIILAKIYTIILKKRQLKKEK